MSALGRTSRLVIFLSAALAAGLWIAYGLTATDAVLGQGPVHVIVHVAAIVATAALAVAGGGALILSRAVGAADGEPTGLLRVLVYGVLTFAASFVTLSYFGFDLRAVLTTSAIVTAAVGFAMQPTLGSVISGLALHMDRAVRVGDMVVHEGETLRLTALNWRTAVGRTSSGRIVVLPNAKLSDNPMQVIPYDRSTETFFYFLAAASARPQVVRDLATELMTDLPLVDQSLAVQVAPMAYEARSQALRYRVKYWITDLSKADDVEGEAHHRLWYVFQRHLIPYPVESLRLAGVDAPDLAEAPRTAVDEELEALLAGVLQRPAPAAKALAAQLAEAGELLLFAADERLVMPDRTEGRAFFILRGEAIAAPEFEHRPADDTPLTGARVARLGRTAAIKQVAEDLADYIGPYAEYAVHRAAQTVHDFTALCRLVALEIADEGARRRFLDGVCPPGEARAGPGTVLHARRNAAGSLVCGEGLRARGEVSVLALPADLAPRLAAAGG